LRAAAKSAGEVTPAAIMADAKSKSPLVEVVELVAPYVFAELAVGVASRARFSRFIMSGTAC
jgi:hypothetical protein